MTNDVFDVFFSKEEGDDPPELKALSLRMPMRTYRYLEEMAAQAGMSRGAMGVQLMEWGISHALAQLPDEYRNHIVLEVDGPDGL